VPKGSRLDQLEKDIEAGNLKIMHPIGGVGEVESEKAPVAETATETAAT
jgi:hypothetical protein